MVVIKTEFVELPEYCEACCYFGPARIRVTDGWIYANYAARESTLTGVKTTGGVTTAKIGLITAH